VKDPGAGWQSTLLDDTRKQDAHRIQNRKAEAGEFSRRSPLKLNRRRARAALMFDQPSVSLLVSSDLYLIRDTSET
jgi:hypothetical protein